MQAQTTRKLVNKIETDIISLTEQHKKAIQNMQEY
jgi:hypothetical protein